MRLGLDLRCLIEPAGSGVATYTRQVLKAVSQSPRARDITWVGFTSGWGAQITPSLPMQMTLRHLRVPNRLLNASLTVLDRPHLRSLMGDVTAVWQPNPLFFPTTNVPQVVTIHDLSFVRYPSFFAWRTRLWYLRWVKAWLARAPQSAHVVCVSEATADDLLSIYPQWRGRSSVVPPPPPSAAENPRTTIDLTETYGIRRPYVLSVATLESRKNIEGVIAGFASFAKQYPDFALVLVGQWGNGRRTIERRLQQLYGSARIHRLGYVDDNIRRALYQQAFCLVYPSFYEGYGYPPLEAMAYGVPVIASAASSLPEILGGAVAFVDPDHAGVEVAVALAALAESGALYEEYRRRSRDRLAALTKSFSIEPLIDVWQRFASA